MKHYISVSFSLPLLLDKRLRALGQDLKQRTIARIELESSLRTNALLNNVKSIRCHSISLRCYFLLGAVGACVRVELQVIASKS